MRSVTSTALSLLLMCSWIPRALADGPTCVLSVQGADTGQITAFHDKPGQLLLGADNGLFRYSGNQIVAVDGDEIGSVEAFQETSHGLLLGTESGLFRYDGKVVVRVDSGNVGPINRFHDEHDGLLGGYKGVFRYNGKSVTHVAGEDTGNVLFFHNVPEGVLIGAWKGLFRYDGDHVIHIGGEDTGYVSVFHDEPGGLLIGTSKGLFQFAGKSVIRISGGDIGKVEVFHDVPGGVLVGSSKGLFLYDGKNITHLAADTGNLEAAETGPGGVLLGTGKGLFKYDGDSVVPVASKETKSVFALYHGSTSFLLSSENGLFQYDGKTIAPVKGDKVSRLFDEDIKEDVGGDTFHEGPDGLLLSAGDGLYRIISEPLSTSQVAIVNSSQLEGTAPNSAGISIEWSMVHPCAMAAGQFGLYVIATDAAGKDDIPLPVHYVRATDGRAFFEVSVPISKPGEWTFRVVSIVTGHRINVGKRSSPVTFVEPGAAGWLAAHWPTLAESASVLWVVLNLIIFACARYSAPAWRLATDEAWGKTVLIPLTLLLRHWRVAQLWILDLYVQGRRNALSSTQPPFLALPLVRADGVTADSLSILARLSEIRHLWVQGGTGMGKTAIFLHLLQTHFGEAGTTSFSAMRRHGYVLVPIEARRFPEVTVDEKGASAWVVACATTVLSERGLSFDDRGLLRAMFHKGTLGVVIDGLSEVSRTPAVNAFASEYPATSICITSQESGELPFEVWRLPPTISAHVRALLTLYLGGEQADALISRLQQSGLFQYLRSGYDVRLVSKLSDSDSLPRDRLELYGAAVSMGWPEGDDRLEVLQAAAWKLVSDRNPNEDKRRLQPDVDAPRELLEKLEAVRERYGRSIRLIRGAPSGYEFVHDQMSAYLAACWLCSRPTVISMCDLLGSTKAWQDSLETQRTLWDFAAAMLDKPTLETLWIFAGDNERRAVLGRALAERAEREGWALTRPSTNNPADDS